MKRSIIFLLLCFISIISFSQKRITVANWDNEIYFLNSRNPVIKNYGPLSDSLSSIYDVDFLFYDDKYFALNSWADYYYWYSQRFWYLLPFTYSLYEYYYHTKNNFGMVGIVVGNSYLGRYYPSYISIELEDETMLNRLSAKRTPNTYTAELFKEDVTHYSILAKALKNVNNTKPRVGRTNKNSNIGFRSSTVSSSSSQRTGNGQRRDQPSGNPTKRITGVEKAN